MRTARPDEEDVFGSGYDIEVLGSCHQFQVIEQQAATDSPLQPGEQERYFLGEDKGRRGGHGADSLGSYGVTGNSWKLICKVPLSG